MTDLGPSPLAGGTSRHCSGGNSTPHYYYSENLLTYPETSHPCTRYASRWDAGLCKDGAPLHYGNIVREFLDTTFPQRWIGRGAVMAWPPRSPDITPLDFYLWGYVKQHVYSERINGINHLKQRITDIIHSVTPIVLTRVWEELDYRLDMCRATNGAHIELR
ncbi:hypothetical protein AVEN_177443-1 [Araneus ventricosus]|uniref:Transposable element Tc3 transposase n=1 Tax=Araneus ventricosus TaxID=182803 RepID=A0A4Y2LBG2_ARAVE|nr:hypothetical protein AVEN_177443-1 [Araneus ventricosus]